MNEIGVSIFVKIFNKLLRPVLFGAVGAILGLIYYLLVGCPDGACAITSSPINSMVYLGIIGVLFSMMTDDACGCNGDDSKCR